MASAGDTIEIPPGNYTLTSGSELVSYKGLTLFGEGAVATRIQAASLPGVASFRVFNITGGNVAISGLTIRHGKSTGYLEGILNEGELTLTNSTITDNTATRGGGIRNAGGGMVTLTNSTITDNTATRGGGIDISGGTVGGTNTIIADNSSGNDCSGAFISLGHNLDSDGSCGLSLAGDIPEEDPHLGPLRETTAPPSPMPCRSAAPL